MSDQNYYAKTAYDSTRPRELPLRLSGKNIPKGQGWWRKRRRLSWGVYFGDYRNVNSRDTILLLREKDEGALAREVSAEKMQFGTLANPKAAWATLRGVAGLFLLVVVVVDVLMLFNIGLEGMVDVYRENPAALPFLLVPLFLFLLSAIAVPFAPNRNNIVFSRRSGLVSLPDWGGKTLQLPFDELDAHISYEVNPMAAIVFWNLTLMHRAGPRWFNFGDRSNKPAYVYQKWELVQQFMDISKPLPDIAYLEPVRHLDPVTVEFDKATGRPPHFWRDRDPEEVQREADEMDAIVRDFFWESLPQETEPYQQHDYVEIWRHYHPDSVSVVDGLRARGWWQGYTEFWNAHSAAHRWVFVGSEH